MTLPWLKRYMPRGLYGRAALILVLPVLILLAIVSVAFIQRHLEDVTTQMTQTVIRELRLVAQVTDGVQTQEIARETATPVLEALQIGMRFVPADEVPTQNERVFYDYSGIVLTDLLEAEFPNLRAIILPVAPRVELYFETTLGNLRLDFDRRRLSAAAPHQLLVIMAFSGMLMVLVAFLYLRNQLRPIMRLADAAQAFGRGRHVAYTPTGAIEVRAAGNAFLDMRARIERHIEQRTMMLSGVSHDLRTPLTRLKLGLSMMDDDEATLLLNDLAEMERMLDEFLSFAKGASAGETEETDPLALVTRIIEDSERAGKPVELVSAKGEGRVALRPVAFRRAVQNLIDNAVRYGARAEVSVALTDKSLRVRVEDDGPGIPEDQRGEALKPFARLDPARNQNRGGGVGLGLAITADVARAHGGVLRLGESKKLGGLRADIVIAR
ncbi:MAG: ATP-binding protein [Paracoccaceae bacterium]